MPVFEMQMFEKKMVFEMLKSHRPGLPSKAKTFHPMQRFQLRFVCVFITGTLMAFFASVYSSLTTNDREFWIVLLYDDARDNTKNVTNHVKIETPPTMIWHLTPS